MSCEHTHLSRKLLEHDPVCRSCYNAEMEYRRYINFISIPNIHPIISWELLTKEPKPEDFFEVQFQDNGNRCLYKFRNTEKGIKAYRELIQTLRKQKVPL